MKKDKATAKLFDFTEFREWMLDNSEYCTEEMELVLRVLGDYDNKVNYTKAVNNFEGLLEACKEAFTVIGEAMIDNEGIWKETHNKLWEVLKQAERGA